MEITLQDVVFMKSLIMQSYRRRMITFYVNIAGFIPGIYSIFVFTSFSQTHMGTYLLVALLAVVCASRLITVYFESDATPRFPWQIKEQQLNIVLNHYSNSARFEELKYCVPLQEFFI